MTISDGDLAGIHDFVDAADLLFEKGYISEERAGQLHGFALRGKEYKESLEGRPFLILEARLMNGVDNTTYEELVIIDVNNRKATIRDSSRGIAEQLAKMRADRLDATGVEMARSIYGIWVRKGLIGEARPWHDTVTDTDKIAITYHLAL